MQPTSVLIVEDEGVVAEDLQQTLVEFGFDAYEIADSADEAIRIASERCPDVVVMDIRIHGQLDGIEAATLIRDRFGAPVVFLTAHTDSATLARAQRAEPYAYLTKPVRPEELRSAVELAAYRSQVERKLRERERSFESTLQVIGDAVITVDLAGNITFMNAEAEALTGLVASAVLGRPSSEIVRFLDGAPETLSSRVERALASGRAVIADETTLVNASTGSERTVSERVMPVVDGSTTVGAVMILREAGPRKARHHELTDRLASLGTLAAGVAHTINNPLTVVSSNATFAREGLEELRVMLAAQGALTGSIADKLDDLVRTTTDLTSAGGRIEKTVADLRSFSGRERGPSGADIHRVVEWAVRETSARLGPTARISTTLTPVPTVVGDDIQLGHVLVNLIVNAAQAIDTSGTIHITVDLTSDGRVELAVIDTGCGILAEIKERVFEPFFTTKAIGVGTGLGLSIVHGIVTSFGGTVVLESEVGRGTTVRLSLAAERGRTTSLPPTRVTAAKARLLVIDDESMVRRAIARALRAHDVVSVENPVDALALLDRGERFDLILSDLMMPNMTGVEFFEELLRRFPELARRVVFITGGALTAGNQEFVRNLPNECVQKPFEVAALQRLVASRLIME